MIDPTGPFLSPHSMRGHLDAGRAQSLYDIPDGPVRFAGDWWYVPPAAAGRGYTPVRDPRLITVLEETALRLRREHASARG